MANWWDIAPLDEEPQRQRPKKPSTPADFPFESVKRAAWAGERSEEIKAAELANAPGYDPMGPVDQPKVIPTPVVGENFWESAPLVEEGGEWWKAAPEERESPSWWETAASIPGTALGMLQQQVGGYLQQKAESGAETVLRSAYSRLVPGLVEGLPSTEEAVQTSKEIHKAGETRIKETIPKEILEATSPGDVNWWKKMTVMAGANILLQAPALAVGIRARNIGLPLSYAAATSEASEYGEQRAADVDPETAARSAKIIGTTEALTELLPMKFMVDAMGGQVLKNILKVVVADIPGELLQTTITSANAKFTRNPDMTWEQYVQDMLDTLGTTMLSSPALAGMATAMHRIQGQPRPPASPAFEPADPDAIALSSVATDIGAEFGPFTDPNFDFPTPQMEGTQLQELKDQAALVDPETLDDDKVEEARKTLVQYQSQEKAKALPLAELAWEQLATAPSSAVDDAGELGASRKQMANAPNYVNPNQEDRRDRQFFAAPADPDAVGLSPRQILPKPGTYGLGRFSDDRPGDYLVPLVESIEQWRQELLPHATIVVSNEQLPNNSSLGSHYTTGKSSHLIVPAVLRKPSRGWAAFNPNTKASAFYNATHEFFHAVISDRFYGPLDDVGVARVRDEASHGLVSEEAVATLPEQQQAVVKEFNAVKGRILNDTMTAEEFVEEWMGPAKIGRKTFLKDLGVSPKAPAKQLVNAIAERSAENSGIADVQARATAKRQVVEDFLGLEEYLAEQGARHAYKKKWAESSPLGKFFGETLRIMRQFFVDRKKDGTIAPGIAFQEWVEGLGKTPRPMEETRRLVEAKKKLPKMAQPTAAPAAFAPTVKKSGFKPQNNFFNTPSLKQNRTYAWRAMGASEFAKLANGQMTYSGDKAATKGNFLAGIPESAAQYGGKGRYLVEFGKVQIRGDEGLQPGSTATRDNVSNVWKNDGGGWTELKAPYAIPVVKESKPKTKVKRVEHNVKSDTKPARRKKAQGMIGTLIRSGVIEGGDQIHGDLLGYIAREEWDEFIDLYTSLSGKTVKFEYKGPESGAFKRRFEGSKVVDRKGEPLIVYHGSPISGEIDFDPAFRGSQTVSSDTRHGWFFSSDPKMSNHFAANMVSHDESRGQLIPAYLRMKNPRVVEEVGYWKGIFFESEIDAAMDEGNDGLIFKRTNDMNVEADVYFVFDRSQIIPVSERPASRVTEDPNWAKEKFSSPDFKAWFGDWERDPEGSSKVRIAAFRQEWGAVMEVDTEIRTPPLVLFTTAARLTSGENFFHAGGVRAQHYAESRRPDTPASSDLVPVVLNIRNPFIQTSVHDPAPEYWRLKNEGYDGIVYQNDFDGDLSFIVFSHDQIKVVPDRAPYKGGQYHLELDLDQSTPQGHGAAKLYRGLKNFVSNPRQLLRGFRHSLKVTRWGMQIQQLKQVYSHVKGIMAFHHFGRTGNAYRMGQMYEPDKVLEFWSDMPNKEFEKFEKFVRAQNASGERWLDLEKTIKNKEGRPVPWWGLRVTEKTLQKAREYGIDPETPRGEEFLAHFKNHEQVLLDDLNEKEAVMQEAMVYRYGKNQLALNASIIILAREIHKLRVLPFVPKAWFGQYQLVVTRKKPDGSGREVVHRQGFDTEKQRDKVFDKVLKNKGPDLEVDKKELTDTQNVLMGLPAEFLKTVSEELDLEPDQVDKLGELLQPVREEKVLKERDLERLGVTGESPDLMQTFASYTWHSANANYKLLYLRKFNMAIEQVRKERDVLGKTSSPEYYTYNNILSAMENTRDYIMHPPNEWHATRTFVTLAYLMGNVKTALVNGSTLALIELRMQAKFGTAEGTKRFLQAVYRTGQGVWNDNKLPVQVSEAVLRAKREGVLSQTYPYHLAGQANASRLWRTLSRRRAVRWLQKDIDLGMKPFRLMEMANRHVSFHAALQEYLDAKQSPEEAYNNAVDQTNALQNDYSAINRVPFTRPWKGWTGPIGPLATIFISWPQHAAFHALGGFEYGQRASGQIPAEKSPFFGYTMRLWALIFAVAGYEGLPFAENAIDIAGWLWRKFGGKKPLRQELREFVGKFVDNPELVARGLGHDVGGMDLSRSIGWGRMFPGTDVMARSQEGTLKENVGTFALDMMGVTGAMMEWMWEMGPLDGKSFEEAMMKAPGLGGNMWTSYQWSKHGVRLPNGTRILTDKDGNPRDPTEKELFFKKLGFNPTEVAREKEIRWAQRDTEQYWLTRRGHLERAVDKARWQEDPEAESDAREAIANFNEIVESVPELKNLRISNGDLARYLKTRRKNRRTQEQQRPLNRRFRNLYEDIRGTYDQPDPEDNQ